MRTLVALLVLVALVAAPMPAQASTVFSHTTVGPASFAARVVTGADGTFSATITSCGVKTASTDGVAFLLFHDDGSFRFGFGVTGHGSPDRTITQLGPLVNGVSVTYPRYGPICPYSSMTVSVGGPSFAAYRMVVWAGGLDGATSFAIGGGAQSATVNVGAAHALGDPELERASANAQVQRRVVGFSGIGVKVIENGAMDIDIAQRAWGFWGYNDAKFVCAGACAGPAALDQACLLAAQTTCDARLSWQGPTGGAAGRQIFTLLGQPAGSYAFRVDHKVDAYNPGGGAYVPPGVLVFPGENYSFLSLADVSMPA